MIATGVWRRVRERIGGTTRPQDEGLRPVALRLAVQTIVLILIMVVALEVVAYVITQGAYLNSLKTTLVDRASQWDPTACQVLRLTCPYQGGGPGRQGGGPGPGPRRPGPAGGGRGGVFPQGSSFGNSPSNADFTASDASVVYVDPQLHVVDAHTNFGRVLPDPRSARLALSTGKNQCCSVWRYEGQNYLVYSRPLRATSSGPVQGVAQTTISEKQYDDTMNSLRLALLVVALLGLLISGGITIALVRRALQPIRAAIQRQRDFVADAAHELRTPLAIMRTVGELGLSEDVSDEDQQATIEQMLAENRHLTRLVDDLSLLARVDSQALMVDRRPVDLSSLVTDTVSELAPLAEEQGVQLQVEAQSNVQVRGDIVRLRQLLLILMDNALKHTPAGGTVSVELRPNNDRSRLEVVDSGPGIASQDLPHVFDRFYQADQARTGKGSGLGLAIGKWITEVHGGQIQAGNATPHGAVFTVTLPLMRAATPVR